MYIQGKFHIPMEAVVEPIRTCVESRNVKSKFHCVMQHGAKHKTFFLHWSINTEYICTNLNIDFKFQNVICVKKVM